jgi:hypothetical protein
LILESSGQIREGKGNLNSVRDLLCPGGIKEIIRRDIHAVIDSLKGMKKMLEKQKSCQVAAFYSEMTPEGLVRSHKASHKPAHYPSGR